MQFIFFIKIEEQFGLQIVFNKEAKDSQFRRWYLMLL